MSKSRENPRSRLVSAAPQRLDIGQAQLFAEQAPRQVGRKLMSARASMSPAPGMLATASEPWRIASKQTGRAEPGGGVQLQRIAPVGVDAPPQHVGALQAGDGAHIELAVVGHEVFALDQQQPEIAGEIDLFGVGFAERAGRQQADARIDALRALARPARKSRKNGASRRTFMSRYRLGKARAMMRRFSSA